MNEREYLLLMVACAIAKDLEGKEDLLSEETKELMKYDKEEVSLLDFSNDIIRILPEKFAEVVW